MNDIQKMLQAIIHGQNALKQNLVGRIDKLDGKLTGRIDSLDMKLARFEANIGQQLDNLILRLDRLVEQKTKVVAST